MTKVKKVFSGVWVVIQVAFALVVLVFALLLIGSVILAGYGLYLYRHEIVIFIFTISLLALIGSLWLFYIL